MARSRINFLKRPLRIGRKVLAGNRVNLRPPLMRDYPHWMKLRRDNQKYLQMREPLWMPDELSRRSFRMRLRAYNQEARQDRGTDDVEPVQKSGNLRREAFPRLGHRSVRVELCGNQPVCRVQFLDDDAAVLAPSSGDEPESPRRRAGVASMAWRTTRDAP